MAKPNKELDVAVKKAVADGDEADLQAKLLQRRRERDVACMNELQGVLRKHKYHFRMFIDSDVDEAGCLRVQPRMTIEPDNR